MNTLSHRLLVMIHGQDDSMATPLADTDSNFYDNDCAPDANRVIQPPPPIEVDPEYRARVFRWAWAATIAGYLLLAALLKLAGARSFE